jgi:ligand-binding SRPBCC domain-containing protein
VQHDAHFELFVPRPVTEVYAFFKQPANLLKLTPPAFDLILTSQPDEIGPGVQLEFYLRLWGRTMKWVSVVEHCYPPYYFADRQLKGPYQLWNHEHFFIPAGEGTLIMDKIVYRLPFFPFGELAYPVVKKRVNDLLAYRQQALKQLFT